MPDENVTTKFRVDVSDLKKNITEANKQVKQYKAELANASAGMKKGEESAESLTKKIEAQSKIVEAEKKKLEAMKAELAKYETAAKNGSRTVEDLARKHEEASKAFGENSEEAQKLAKQLETARTAQERNLKAVDDLRLKIVNQDTAVKNAEGQVRNFSEQLDGLQKEEKETGDEAEETTNGGLKAFSVALGNLAANIITDVIKKLGDMGTAAIDAFEQFDAGRDALIKATGASGEAADELTAAYSSVAKNVSGDLEDIGAAVGEVNTRFGYTGDELSKVSEDFMKFADITGTDAVSAVQGISKALAGAGMPAEDYAQLLDKVTAAAQASGISADTLTEGLSKYGTQMRSIGYDVDDTIALLSQFEKSGVNAETAMKGLQTANIAWTKEGKNAKDELAAVIKEIEKAPSSTEAAQKAIETFGNKAGTELADAIRSGRFEFEDFSKVVAGSSGTVGRTFEETQSGIDKIKLAAQGLSVTFGEAAGKLVEEFAPGIENIISLFTKVISGDDEAEDELADAIGGFVEGALSKAVSSLPSIVGFVSRLTGKLVEALAGAAPDIVSGAVAAIRSIINGLTGFLPTLIGVIADVIPKVLDALIEAAPQVIKATMELASRVAKALPSLIVKLVEYIPQLVQGIADFISTQTPIIIQSAIDIVTGLVQALPDIMQALVDAIPGLIKTLTDFMAQNAPMLLQAVLDIVTALVKAAPEIAKAIYPMIPQIMDALVEGVVNFIPVWIDTFRTMFDTLAAAIPGIWENVMQSFSEVFELWKTNIFDRARDAFGEIWDHIKEKVSPIGQKIGDAIGGAFKATINSAIEFVEERLNAIPNAINRAIDTLNALPGVNISPMDTITLPRLAKGGIVDRATLAQIGEAGREAIIPLDRNKAGLKEIARLLREEIANGANSGAMKSAIQSTGTNVALTQNITSPKALSTYDTWRQTRNMLNLVKLQGV